jgi:hypothetical protein
VRNRALLASAVTCSALLCSPLLCHTVYDTVLRDDVLPCNMLATAMLLCSKHLEKSRVVDGSGADPMSRRVQRVVEDATQREEAMWKCVAVYRGVASSPAMLSVRCRVTCRDVCVCVGVCVWVLPRRRKISMAKKAAEIRYESGVVYITRAMEEWMASMTRDAEAEIQVRDGVHAFCPDAVTSGCRRGSVVPLACLRVCGRVVY